MTLTAAEFLIPESKELTRKRKMKEAHLRWRTKHPEKYKYYNSYAYHKREIDRKYYENNKDKCLAKSKRYVEENRERVNEQRRERYRVKNGLV